MRKEAIKKTNSTCPSASSAPWPQALTLLCSQASRLGSDRACLQLPQSCPHCHCCCHHPSKQLHLQGVPGRSFFCYPFLPALAPKRPEVEVKGAEASGRASKGPPELP